MNKKFLKQFMKVREYAVREGLKGNNPRMAQAAIVFNILLAGLTAKDDSILRELSALCMLFAEKKLEDLGIGKDRIQ